MTQLFRRAAGRTALAAALALTGVAFIGCEQKERVIDVKTPNRRVEVERSKGTGKVDVNVESPRRDRVEVEAPKAKVEVERSNGR
jgi:hypothetical protein